MSTPQDTSYNRLCRTSLEQFQLYTGWLRKYNYNLQNFKKLMFLLTDIQPSLFVESHFHGGKS